MKERKNVGQWKLKSGARSESGFTVLQMLLVLAIIGIVIAIAVISIKNIREQTTLARATGELRGYLEKARIDSMRRHAQDNSTMASVQFSGTGATSYSVTMDFTGSGTMTTRTVTLPSGVSFTQPSAATTIRYNWRGRTTGEVSVTLNNTSGSGAMNISGSGDVTQGSDISHDSSLPSMTLYNSNVNGDVSTK